MLGWNNRQAHLGWVGLMLYGVLKKKCPENLEERFLRSPHQPLQVWIFFCIVSRAWLFLDLSLCATRFFIFFFQLLDPLSVAFG